MAIPAIVTAGDQVAAKAVYGQSKVYLEIEDRPLVAFVVAALQRVPEVSEVWLVGDAERLRALFEREDLARELRKPLHIVPQSRNLYENCWHTYRRLLPGAGPEGRDPEPPDADLPVLFVSGDLPFATPQEISQFIQRGLERGCDYALGLVREEEMREFYPRTPDEPGVHMAYFNLREGRFRQSNLHLVKPARLGNRHYIEEMYENRYQKQAGPIVRLAWTILRSERGGLRVLWYYLLMHFSGVVNRHGFTRVADWIRRFIPIARIERGCSDLLRTELRFVETDMGGCALDIDNEHDYDAARERYADWRKGQEAKAERRLGPLPLPERGGPPGAGAA
jgi:hypothetical protein